MSGTLTLQPMNLGEARKFVELHHSHHHAPIGGLCAVGVACAGRLVCVAILSRPVARRLQAQGCVEVSRVASDGTTEHAASKAIGAIARAAIALGWRRLVSYTLLGEAGTSYRAAGWRVVMVGEGNQFQWNCSGRVRELPTQPGAKVRWEFGPEALPLNEEADRAVREAAGGVGLPARAERMPLFSSVEAAATSGRA